MGTVIDGLVQAVNEQNLEGVVACFADDYVNETPVHPRRGFRGSDQVRTNWAQIFAGVADMQAAVLRQAKREDQIWTEWDMSGSRREDGGPFLMRGVVIFEIRGELISSARFYLEPVEEASGDVDAHTRRVVTGIEPS
jgi:hypothetical protein